MANNVVSSKKTISLKTKVLLLPKIKQRSNFKDTLFKN